MKSIGVIEVVGVVAAVQATDTMLKKADVEILTCEKKLGGRLVSIVIQGSTSTVREAILNAEVTANCVTKTVAKCFINNSHEEVTKIIEKSAQNINK